MAHQDGRDRAPRTVRVTRRRGMTHAELGQAVCEAFEALGVAPGDDYVVGRPDEFGLMTRNRNEFVIGRFEDFKDEEWEDGRGHRLALSG